jgi:hypothetical protein
MNFRTTTILIALLAVVGVIVLIAQRESKPAVDPDAAGGKKLFSVGSADVGKLIITPADGKRIVFEKSKTDWNLVEPIAAGANSFSVDSLISSILELRSRGQVDPGGENASSIGLDKPRFVVQVQGKDGKLITLKVGNRQTVGDTLYVQLDGDKKATVVAAELFEQLDKPFAEYRQTKLVSVPATDIRQIEISRPDGKLALDKTDADWQITVPEKMSAEPSEISSITSAISFLTAAEFVAEADVPAPLNPANNPRLTIWFSSTAPTTQPAAKPTTREAGVTIKVGGYDSILKKNVYIWVSNPPTLAKVAATSLDAFNKKPLDLRDRKVLDIEPAGVSLLSVVTDFVATTQPTSRPASKSDLTIERKKVSLNLGPEAPSAAATKPTTKATTKASTKASTQATTQATTAPALPPTNWAIKKTPSADADEFRIEALLAKFHPLKADKYLPAVPKESKPAARYTVTLATESAAKSARYELRLSDVGEEKPLIGEYGGLVFEVPHSLLQSFTGDFNNKPKPPAEPASPPPGFNLP